MARHVHEDALDDDEFEKLLAGAKRLDPPWNLEAMFVVLVWVLNHTDTQRKHHANI